MTTSTSFVSKSGASKGRLFWTPLIYGQISADQVIFKNLTNGKTFSDSPHMALSTGPDGRLVEAVGRAAFAVAEVQQVDLVNPFGHPRTLVSQVALAELLLKYLYRQVKSRWSRAPIVIIHPLGPFDGGLTEVEIRVLQELAVAAGAKRAQVWDGRVLTDQEIKTSPTLFGQYAMFRPGLSPLPQVTSQVPVLDTPIELKRSPPAATPERADAAHDFEAPPHMSRHAGAKAVSTAG